MILWHEKHTEDGFFFMAVLTFWFWGIKTRNSELSKPGLTLSNKYSHFLCWHAFSVTYRYILGSILYASCFSVPEKGENTVWENKMEGVWIACELSG